MTAERTDLYDALRRVFLNTKMNPYHSCEEDIEKVAGSLDIVSVAGFIADVPPWRASPEVKVERDFRKFHGGICDPLNYRNGHDLGVLPRWALDYIIELESPSTRMEDAFREILGVCERSDAAPELKVAGIARRALERT